MKKRFIALMLSATMALPFATAAHAEVTIPSSVEFQGTPVELSLEKAIDIMLKDNPTIKAAQLNLDEAGVTAEKGITIPKDGQGNPLEGERKELYNNINRLTKESAKKTAEVSYKATVNGLRIDIEQSYFGILQAEEAKKINEDNVSVAKELYDIANNKLSLGLITKQEVLSAELNYIQTQNTLDQSIKDLIAARLLFNTKLGFDVMQDVRLTDKLEFKEFTPVNITEVVQSALNKRFEVVSSDYALKLEGASFELVSYEDDPITYKYRLEKIKLENATKTSNDTKNIVIVDVLNNYLTIIQKQKEIQSGQKAVESAQEALRLSKLTYETGDGLQTDVMKSQVLLQSSRLQLSKALLDYNMAVVKFQNSIVEGAK